MAAPADLSKGERLKYVVIAIAGIICYGNAIPNGYAYDDAVVITENQFTQAGITGIPKIFSNNTFVGSYDNVPTLERYRPLSVATFAVEHQLFGQNPQMSHLNNVLLYVLTTLVLYRLLSKVFGNYGDGSGLLDWPLVATLLFAVHPIHTEVVANIKGRDEILALAGSLSGTLLVLKYLDRHEVLHLISGFGLFLMALFSKENAVTFLAVVPMTVFYYKKARGTDYLYSSLPLVAACIVFLGVRQWVLGEPRPPFPQDIITEPFFYASLSQKLATIGYTFGLYVKLLFVPYPLTIDYYPYHVRLMSWTNAAVWLSVIAYVSLAVHAVWRLRERSVVAYGILFYMMTFSVVSNVPFSIGTFMSERFMFMPSLGFVIAFAALLSHPAFPLNKHRDVMVLALALACCLVTHSRNRVWRNDFTLFTADVKTSENSIKANLAASVTLLTASNGVSDGALSREYRAEALKYARRAVAIFEANVSSVHRKGTSYDHAMTLLGDCYGAVGMLESALQCYRRILHSVSNRDALCNAIERTISRSDDVDFKIASYAEFAALVPDNFVFNYQLGLLYGKEKNELTKAVQYLDKAVELDPSHVDALRALSHAHQLAKDYERAVVYWERVVDLRPGSVPFLKQLRMLHELAGHRAQEEAVTRRIENLEKSQGG